MYIYLGHLSLHKDPILEQSYIIHVINVKNTNNCSDMDISH